MVIHEAFGLNADTREHADRLAAAGYLALAPDMFNGVSWLRCVRGAFRQLHARSGPAFDALDAARGEYSAVAVNYGEVPEEDAWRRIPAFFGQYLS